MQKLVLALIFITTPYLVRAQFSISGNITDAESQQPLPGAQIAVVGTSQGTASDSDGHYMITKLQAGKYTLQFSFVGYRKQTREVDLQADLTLHISLAPMTILAEEVIVSATRAGDKTPIAFTNLSKEAIQQRNFGQDLPFLLNETPSVVVTSDAGAGIGYTGIRIRGSDPTRINVTVNGIPLNDAESHGVYWVNMPDFASSVDNIQIQRGVGTSTNGAGAFGASLNVQTESYHPEPYAEAGNAYGSFNTWKHTVKVGSGLIGGRWTFDGRLSKISSDGYLDRARSDLKSFFVSGGYHGKKTVLKANIFSGREVTYQSWYGVPESRYRNDAAGMNAYIERNGLSEADAQNLLQSGRRYNFYTYDNQTDNYQQDHYQLIFSHQPSSAWNLNAALHYTRGRGYYEEYAPGDSLNAYGLPEVTIGDSVISTTDIIRRRWLDNHFFGATWSATYGHADKWNVIIGGGANRYLGQHFGELVWARVAGDSNYGQHYYDNYAWKNDVNGYAKGNYQLGERLNAFVDLQYRRIDYSFLGYNQRLENVQQQVHYNFFNPKAGLTYAVNPRINLYASYSVGHREPTRDDFTQSTPESRPKPEVLRNVEAGIRRQTEQNRFGINFYLMNYKNQLVLTGKINDVGNYTRINIGRSYRAGVELEGSLQLLKKLTWTGNATFSRNKIQKYQEFVDDYDTGEQQVNEYRETDISFSPNLIASSNLSYSPLKDLTVALVSKYVGSQYLDNTSNPNRKLDRFFVNDLRINYLIKPKFVKEVGIGLLVNNLFDVKYASNGYTWGYLYGGQPVTENFYYPQAGINFLTTLNFRF